MVVSLGFQPFNNTVKTSLFSFSFFFLFKRSNKDSLSPRSSSSGRLFGCSGNNEWRLVCVETRLGDKKGGGREESAGCGAVAEQLARRGAAETQRNAWALLPEQGVTKEAEEEEKMLK